MQEGGHEGDRESRALVKGRAARGGEEGWQPRALHRRLCEAKAQTPGLLHSFAASSGRMPEWGRVQGFLELWSLQRMQGGQRLKGQRSDRMSSGSGRLGSTPFYPLLTSALCKSPEEDFQIILATVRLRSHGRAPAGLPS